MGVSNYGGHGYVSHVHKRAHAGTNSTVPLCRERFGDARTPPSVNAPNGIPYNVGDEWADVTCKTCLKSNVPTRRRLTPR